MCNGLSNSPSLEYWTPTYKGTKKTSFFFVLLGSLKTIAFGFVQMINLDVSQATSNHMFWTYCLYLQYGLFWNNKSNPKGVVHLGDAWFSSVENNELMPCWLFGKSKICPTTCLGPPLDVDVHPTKQ